MSKAVPGRKTDVKDSEWIADLLRHGLLQASFIPPKPVRDLRDILRYRKQLIYERTREVNKTYTVGNCHVLPFHRHKLSLNVLIVMEVAKA